MYFRMPDGEFNLANFMRAEIYSAFAALRIGMDILSEKESVPAEKFTGHGGLFKVKGVAQQYLADALGAKVAVMTTAGEGGAWGMALLAAFLENGGGARLPEWLNSAVFANAESTTLAPTAHGAAGFAAFMERYKAALPAQYAAANAK